MNARRASFVRFAFITLLLSFHAVAQTAPQSDAPPNISIPTLHIGTSLTLVDVTAENTSAKLHSRELVSGLQQTDFRVFDNDREVSVSSSTLAPSTQSGLWPYGS